MFLRRCLAAAAPLLLVSIAACSSDASDGSHGRGGYEAQLIEARQQTQDIYARSIDETEARWERCIEDLEATGVCEVEDGTTPKTIRIVVDGLGTQGWRESLQKARAIVGQVRQALRDAKTKMCEVLAPFAGMQHPYFFYGGNVTGAAGGAAQAGFDVVFDIWNQQAAVFTYKGVGLASLAGQRRRRTPRSRRRARARLAVPPARRRRRGRWPLRAGCARRSRHLADR